jgi:hypothetical protein
MEMTQPTAMEGPPSEVVELFGREVMAVGAHWTGSHRYTL